MKVLLAHKFFYPKGGDAVVFFATADLLRKKSHTPVFFSMAHPKNLSSEYSKYFVSYIDLNDGGGALQQLKIAGRILYSFEAKKNIERLIHDTRPDIAHLHNISHQISPSVIDALKKNNIPVVMTLHDYKLTCPVYTHLTNGKVCEECRNGRYYNVFMKRCTKGSRLKSALNMAEMYLHHNMLHIYEKVDMFISPSRFLMEKTKGMGFKGEIVYLPNFVDSMDYQPVYGSDNNSIIYFGRLSGEKGLFTLIDAIKGNNNIELKIIGEGPLRDELQLKVRNAGLHNIQFPGFKSGDELKDEIRKSLCVVIPSEWYENNPRSVLEAFAMGKPVIGARIGGIPELVKDGETGFTFAPGDSKDLANKIALLTGENNKTVEMGKKARDFVEREFNPEQHYKSLMEIYKKAIKSH